MTTETTRTLEEIVAVVRTWAQSEGAEARTIALIREAYALGAASRASPEAVKDDLYTALCEAERKLSESRTENARLEVLIYAERSARASPDEGRALRPEVLAFAHAMEAKLRKHDGDRGPRGWIGCYVERLLAALNGERLELTEAVEKRQGVLSEAADVGNFAMMIADVCGALRSPTPEPSEDASRLAGTAYERCPLCRRLTSPPVAKPAAPPPEDSGAREGES